MLRSFIIVPWLTSMKINAAAVFYQTVCASRYATMPLSITAQPVRPRADHLSLISILEAQRVTIQCNEMVCSVSFKNMFLLIYDC